MTKYLCIKKYTSRELRQTLQTTKMNFGKMFSKTTTVIPFNLPQVCPSVLAFVFTVLSTHSFNVLSRYFNTSFHYILWHSSFNSTCLFSWFLVNLNTLACLLIQNRPRYNLPCPAIEDTTVFTTRSIMQKSWLSGCSRLTNRLNTLIKALSPPTSRTLDWHSAEFTEIEGQMFWAVGFFNTKPMEKCL